MNRSQFNKAVVPGLFALGTVGYRRKAKEAIWEKLAVAKSSKAYEEAAYFAGLGMPAVKPEGQPVSYDEHVQGPTKRWTHKTYGLATTITEEVIDDTLYSDVPTTMAQQTAEIGDSFTELWEVLVHNVINNGTATTYHTGGDALALFSGSHTSLRGGTWSNLLSPAADLSAASLQASLDNFMLTKDDTGKYQVIKPRQIWVHPNNAWKLTELLDSKFDPESANNAVNVISRMGLAPQVSPYLTDTDAFTLKAKPATPSCGLIAYMRRPVKFATDGDFETGDFKYKGTARFSVEFLVGNNLYHSAGA